MEESVVVEVELPDDGGVLAIRATNLGGAQDVGFHDLKFADVTNTIEHVGKAVKNSISKAAPDRASVEFGVEVAVSAGKLVSILAEGKATATLTVRLEWGNAPG